MDDARAWQTRPLEDVYPVVFLDCMVLKIRDGASVQRRACYLAMAIGMDGEREVLEEKSGKQIPVIGQAWRSAWSTSRGGAWLVGFARAVMAASVGGVFSVFCCGCVGWFCGCLCVFWFWGSLWW